ncbi:MAG: tetratricopeptide repeat protein [Pirellulales bacterium]|nr:tetratricopeptide repeat protein [Pirellulales bacterium]
MARQPHFKALLCTVALLVLTTPLRAADPQSDASTGPQAKVPKSAIVGDQVLPCRETVHVLEAGQEKNLPSNALLWPAAVIEREGKWLRVKSPANEVEVLAIDVVAINAANEFFGAEIKAQPTAWKHKLRCLARQWEGDFDGALADVNAALHLTPRDPELHCQRGVLLMARREVEPALEAFTEALRVNPQFLDAYRRRSDAWLASGNAQRAIDDLGAVIALEPDDLIALLERAKLLALSGEFDRAAEDFSKLLARNPGNPEILRARAELRLLAKRTAEGIADLSDILKQRPGDTRVLYLRGLAYGQAQDHNKALADFSAILERDIVNTEAYLARAAVYLKLERYDKALRDLAEIVRLEPRHALAHYQLALIWATCPVDKYRDGQRALEAARQACLLTDWKQPPCLMALAAANAEVGNFEDAVHWQTKAQEMIPAEDRAAFQSRLDCYTAQKPYRDLPTKTR